jgi:hypothetical protein
MQCQELRGVLTHELAHYFRSHLPTHSINSVLTGNTIVGGLVSRTLWNEDINDIFTQYWPKRPVGVALDLLIPGWPVSNFGGTTITGGANHTAAVGTGGAANMYARVFTDTLPGVWFQQGDGYYTNWSSPQLLSNASEPTTYHRTCMATTNTGTNMLVAWTSNNQIQLTDPGMASSTDAGTRSIIFVESATGGASWTAPAAI